MSEAVRETTKERNFRNNQRIREIVNDSERNPIRELNRLDGGIVVVAIDTTVSRKTLRKALQRFCAEKHIRIKPIDRRVAEAIRLIRTEGIDVYTAARRVSNGTELVRRIQYQLCREQSGDEGVVR